MKKTALQWFGMAAIIQIGLFRLYEAPRIFVVSHFIGVLFAAAFILALIAALRIYRGEAWGWTLGAVISVASLGGFVWSRVFGFMSLKPQNWLEPVGLVSAVVEIGFIGLFILHALQPSTQAPTGARGGLLFSAAAVVLVAVISLATYQWDNLPAHSKFGRPTAYLSQEDLANQYGVGISQIAVTAMDSIIDLRLRIFDIKKASNLIGNPDLQPYLLVGTQPEQVIPVAHLSEHHMHNIRQGSIFVFFFPNPRNSIKPGTPISLVFGNVRVESVVLK